jgi:hypothetical protein
MSFRVGKVMGWMCSFFVTRLTLVIELTSRIVMAELQFLLQQEMGSLKSLSLFLWNIVDDWYVFCIHVGNEWR